MMAAVRTKDRLDGDASTVRDDDDGASMASAIESARIDATVTYPT